MALLSVTDISKSFSERLLFENITFEISQNDRIGLVGVNGCGKTTLFRILRDEDMPDAGNIYRSSDLRIGVMNQSVEDFHGTLYEYVLMESAHLSDIEAELEEINDKILSSAGDARDALIRRQDRLRVEYEDRGGMTYRSRTRSCLLGLGFSENELGQALSTMSGGQKNKAQLARLLLSDANLLLLDEPTNHLDIEAVTWLEDYLLGMKCAFMVISHDRYFLDRVTNKTIEIKNCRMKLTNGNYSRHTELCATMHEIEERKYRNAQREIRRIEGIIEQQKRFGRERNFITAESKQKQVDRLKAELIVPEKDTASIHFSFKAKDCIANDVLIAEGLSKEYDGRTVFSGVDMLVKNGERVFILGSNGCGKTTLLRILSRREYPSSGRCHTGPGVLTGYYDQNVSSSMGSGTLLDEIQNAYPLMNTGDIRSAMAQFLFKGDAVFNSAQKASGGERARVQLLRLMLSGANLLLLDEPTNHLDIASREALENALEDYSGTLIVVTHDRYLVNRLADRVLYMTENGLCEYMGGYDEYLAAKEEKAESEQPKKVSDNALDYKAQKELKSTINRTRGELDRTEKAIAQKEKELSDTELAMNTPDYKKVMELSVKADALRADIDALYAKWEELSDKLEELTGSATE